MRRDDELYLRERSSKTREQFHLPPGVYVQIHFIDQNDTLILVEFLSFWTRLADMKKQITDPPEEKLDIRPTRPEKELVIDHAEKCTRRPAFHPSNDTDLVQEAG